MLEGALCNCFSHSNRRSKKKIHISGDAFVILKVKLFLYIPIFQSTTKHRLGISALNTEKWLYHNTWTGLSNLARKVLQTCLLPKHNRPIVPFPNTRFMIINMKTRTGYLQTGPFLLDSCEGSGRKLPFKIIISATGCPPKKSRVMTSRHSTRCHRRDKDAKKERSLVLGKVEAVGVSDGKQP